VTDDYRTRRRLLQSLGGAPALVGLAGCQEGDFTETPRPPPTSDRPPTDSPTTDVETGTDGVPEDAVNVVEAGASPDGDEPTVPILDDIVGDATTIAFPPGEYLLTQEWRVKSFDDLTILGDDATFRVEEGYDDNLFVLGNPDGANGLTVAGLAFDVSAPETGARPIQGMVSDGLLVRDVTVAGHQDVDQDSVRFDVTDPDGTGVVERLRLPDGGDPEYPITGCYVGEDHTGTLRFVDCHVAGFPDNGLYASPATGAVIVEGGRYENNDISNVRVSGPAEVRDVHVRCDTAPDGFSNMRGIRLREGRDIIVEGCTIEMDRVTGSDGAITMSTWLDAATIRDTQIDVDADGVPAVLAKAPNDEVASDGTYQIRVENVTVSGTAEGTAAVRLVQRKECLVDDVCIHQSGQARDGVHCTRVSASTLRNSSIAVTGRPVVLENASLDRKDLRTERIERNADLNASSCK